MLVYRIVYKLYSNILHAPGVSGRWNGDDRKVVYAAESIPLAFLENMIRRKGIGFNHDFRTMIIEVPDRLGVIEVKPSDLEPGWRDFKNYSKCQHIGNAWYDKGETPILKVPSAVLPDNSNYVLNTTHADYIKIALLGVTDLVPDLRIEEILKKYSG